MMYCPRCGAQYGGPGNCARCGVPVQYSAGYAPPRQGGCGGNGCIWAIVALVALGILSAIGYYVFFYIIAR